jgi:hypothetical protein
VVRGFAQQILIAKAGSHQPEQLGEHWVDTFLHRHPALRTKVGRVVSQERIRAAHPKSAKAFYEYLSRVRKQYHVKPENEYNMDETGIQEGETGNGTVIGHSRSSRTRIRKSEATSWVSIIEYISPLGSRGTPGYIFSGRSVQSQWFPEDIEEE